MTGKNVLNNACQFEIMVGKILSANDFIIVSPKDDGAAKEYDFLARFGGNTWAIEVKYYRTARAQVSLIESAAARLANKIHKSKGTKGMLVVACGLQPDIRLILENKFGLVFIDRSDLYSYARKAPEFLDELSALIQEDGSPDILSTGRDITKVSVGAHKSERLLSEDTMGTDLCNELRLLSKGKIKWVAYEKLCDRILRYLFKNDLIGWHKQKRTDDGLNRFDYICRIRSTTEFWKFLAEHLNSRYVVFEFKNYNTLIKQGQILTTEKYLLEKGLRRVAIVLSRKGADKGALAMTQGAMRENGKLMLILDDNKVCQMLHLKERGEDPSDLLYEVADDFLLSLPR